jgi:hypothetical protein
LFWFYLLSSLETKAKGKAKMSSQTRKDSSHVGPAVLLVTAIKEKPQAAATA